ncbi:hypothetical protein Tco_1138088 [Tanacetum coccineum]
MSSNSDDIQAAGSDTRPPMLDRTDYESWSQRIRLYYRGKENGLQILQSIDQGPFELGTTRDTLGTTPEGGVLLGPERPRTYEDLSNTEKKRYDADVRATNIVLQADECDAFDSDVDDEPTTQFDSGVCPQSVANPQAGPSNASILSEVHTLENAIDHSVTNQDEHEIHNEVQQPNVIDSTSAKKAQPALYDGDELLKPHHVPVIVPSSEEDTESSKMKGRRAKGQCPTPACPATCDCVSSQYTGPSGPSNASNYKLSKYWNILKEFKTLWSLESLGNEKQCLEIGCRGGPDEIDLLDCRGNTIRELKEKISRLTEKNSDADPTLDLKALVSQNKYLTTKLNALHDLNERFRAQNEKVKHHYKELYDSIKITRAKTIEHTTSLISNNDNFKAQLQEKGFAIAALKNELRKITRNSVNTKFAKSSILGKPVLQQRRKQSVVRQPTAFKSEQRKK